MRKGRPIAFNRLPTTLPDVNATTTSAHQNGLVVVAESLVVLVVVVWRSWTTKAGPKVMIQVRTTPSKKSCIRPSERGMMGVEGTAIAAMMVVVVVVGGRRAEV